MKRAVLSLMFATLAVGPLVAQSEGMQDEEGWVSSAHRRTPLLRNDPFRHVLLPHWGVVFSVGASAENNTLLLTDLSALLVNQRDTELIDDVVQALDAVPSGGSLQGVGQGEGGIYFGGPLHRSLNIGVSAQARGYGAFRADDDAIVLVRDGVGGQRDFTLGSTGGSVIATVEYGIHGLFRMRPLGDAGRMELSIGVGGRYVRPLGYGRGQSLIDSRLEIVGDSIAARIELEQTITPGAGFSQSGSGFVGDFVVRADWHSSGFALEAMVANLGSVSLGSVERRNLSFVVSTTNLSELNDSLETALFQVQDTIAWDVTLPRIVRFAASAWATRFLQLDGGATLGSGGEFGTPFVVDLGSTWRFDPTVPLRLGLVLGGHQGVGYTAGMGVESRHFLFEVSGGSLGGLFSDATGFAGRFDLGLFF